MKFNQQERVKEVMEKLGWTRIVHTLTSLGIKEVRYHLDGMEIEETQLLYIFNEIDFPEVEDLEEKECQTVQP